MNALTQRFQQVSRAVAPPVLAGVLYALSWAGHGLWPLAFVCFVPIVLALRGCGPSGALWRGLLMGLVAHMVACPWLLHTTRALFALSPALSFLAYLLVCLAEGLVLGAAALLFVLVRRARGWPAWICLPLALSAAEQAIPQLFESHLGVSLLPATPLVQLADLGGVILVSALAALVNGALSDALPALLARRRPAREPLLAAALALTAAYAHGSIRIAAQEARERAAPHRNVGIVQPAVGAAELHEAPVHALTAARELTKTLVDRGADVVLWPETAFNTGVVRLDRSRGADVTAGLPVAVLTGAQRVDATLHLYNSAILVSKDGAIRDAYDKVELIPFGEKNPLEGIFPGFDASATAHFSAGKGHAPIHDGAWRYATSICYEGTQPSHVRRLMQDDGEGLPHLLVNLTNDSWFGAGFEPAQHLALQAMRAIEHRRWLARASTTGISAFVDSSGRVVASVGTGLKGTALQAVPMLEGGTVYGAAGEWPGTLALVVLALLALRAAVLRAPRPRMASSSGVSPRSSPS